MSKTKKVTLKGWICFDKNGKPNAFLQSEQNKIYGTKEGKEWYKASFGGHVIPCTITYSLTKARK